MSHFSILPTNKVLFLSPLQLSFDQSRRLRIAVKKRCMTTYLTSVEGYIHTFAAIFGMSRNAFPKERLGGHCVTSQGTAAKETKGYTVDKKRLDNQVVRALAGRSQPACNCHLFPPPTRRLSVGEIRKEMAEKLAVTKRGLPFWAESTFRMQSISSVQD